MYRLVIYQPAEGDNAHEPQDTEEEGDPVQVPLDDRGGAEGGGHPAAEQVRQAGALTLVQQDEQDHHEARDDQDNGKPDNHRSCPSPAADIGIIDLGTADGGATDSSLRCQFTIPADLSELPGVETGSADRGAATARLHHDRRDVARLNGPAIQDTHTGRRIGVMNL